MGDAAQNCRGYSERRIADHLEGAARQTQIRGVSVHDDDAVAREPYTEQRGTPRVEFNGDDLGSCVHQRTRDRPGAGPDVYDEIAGLDTGTVYEPLRPAVIELVPPPVGCTLGHGRPSPSSWRQSHQRRPPPPTGFAYLRRRPIRGSGETSYRSAKVL